MLKSDMLKKHNRDNENIGVEIGGDKSKLKYINFHDYISTDLYNEWKWLFNNLRKIDITTEYADNLLAKVADATTVATDRLTDVVELRVVDMDDSVTADSIDTTLDIMTNHYDRNRDAISATSLDGDIKDKLNNYNVLMHELIVRVKKAMNESIIGIDTELFGFGKKYETCLVSADYDSYLKASKIPTTWKRMDIHNIQKHLDYCITRMFNSGDTFDFTPNTALKDEIKQLSEKIRLFKETPKTLGKKTEWHKTSLDSNFKDDQSFRKWNEKLLKQKDETLKEYDYYILPEVDDNTVPRSLYSGYRNLIAEAFDEILTIRRLIKNNIRVMSKDREEYSDNTKGTYVSRKVVNNTELANWFSSQGIKVVPTEELHTTISYSRAEFNHTPDTNQITIMPSQFKSIEILGEDCLVIKMDSDDLKANFDKCMSEGATYDYDEYIPHITIAIGVSPDIIPTLQLPDFPIILDVEKVEPLDLDWKNKVIDSESLDLELFGFGKEYKIGCTTAVLNIVSNYHEFEFIEKGLSYLEDEDSDIRFDVEECDEVSEYLELVLSHSKKDSNILSKSTKIENDYDDDKWVYAKKNQIDYFHDPKFIGNAIELLSKNKKVGNSFFKYSLDCIQLGLETYKDNKIKTSLNKLKSSIHKAISYIDANIHLVSDDKESYEYNGLSVVTSDVFNYVDMEGFQAISGLIATGFKKVSGVVSDISDMMSTSKPDYNNLVKGFFSKDRRYQDIYNYLIPVPAGYNGYVKDISLYVLNNIHQVNTLDSNLDNLINTLSSYINSSEYRESFAVDMSASKVIEAIASELYKENRKYISESKEDSKPINKLLRSANELDDIIDNLKKADKILDLDQLESIKKKMKQVDNLVTIMIDNKNQYSKPKLLEIAKYIDAIISLSNAVGTVVYLKNSTDIILVDIKNIL